MKTIRRTSSHLSLTTRRIRALALAAALAGTSVSSGASAKSVSAAPGGWGVLGENGQAAGQGVALEAEERMSPAAVAAFRQAISAVENMPNDYALQQRAQSLGLNVLNVLWEDTGRDAGSSVGPNISDVTLQVREPVGGGFTTHLLPVIRFPNFSDKTADIAADKLWIKVGNQARGGELVSVPLTEMLKNIREYVTDADTIGGSGDLSAARDSHMLVSAQHVFVPIPKTGKAEFNPVIFNYQSFPQNPAVLTILATRQGSSVAVIENSGGDQSLQGWGQQLFHNNKGQKTTFTAERKSDVKARIESGRAQEQDVGALDEGADMLMIIQVPLKVKAPRSDFFGDGFGTGIGGLMPAPSSVAMEAAGAPADMDKAERRSRGSDVEQAVIGHGEDLGPVDEGRGRKLVRDDRFPVRVTVQFYKATSNGVISDVDLRDAKKQIDSVYAKGDYVGSLVVPEGSRHRPTDWILGQTAYAKSTLFKKQDIELPQPGDALNDETGPSPDVETPSMWQRFKAWLWH
jgi:hypothetical protein